MDTQDKAKWTAALRSGEYKQTRCTLKNDEGYCCLGVLNEVLGLPQSYIGLPLMVGNWERLARMNDEQGKSFAQIADVIDAAY